MPLQSQTWNNLTQLLSELPRRRARLFVFVLFASFLQGLLDVFLVALLARLVGLLAGARLEEFGMILSTRCMTISCVKNIHSL